MKRAQIYVCYTSIKTLKYSSRVDAIDALMGKGFGKGVAWGTWPRDGAQEDAERRKWEAQGLIKESRGPQPLLRETEALRTAGKPERA